MSNLSMNVISTYLPLDRRRALSEGKSIPDRSQGSVVFADISGFTALTAAFAQELGPQRGAEELTHQINRVYGVLIAEVHRYGGSVISFSGDAITCWFDEDAGALGANCALAMQQAIFNLSSIQTPAGDTITIGIKVAVVAGPVRRFLVGDPDRRQIEVLAGNTLDRVAAGEKLAQPGEIVVGANVAAALHDDVQVLAWRNSLAGEPFAVVTGHPPLPSQANSPPLVEAPPEIARPWLHPPVFARLKRGEAAYLAELRPATALFLRFTGIDYDGDDAAGPKLDAFIRWVQTVLARYEGFLLQLTMGDKGSYLYAVFGALLAHEDDTLRAVAAALELSQRPSDLQFVESFQMGISQGQMYTGGYGGPTRQTYGVMGNEVNIAARLMQTAVPGQILVTSRVMKTAAAAYKFQALDPVLLKGMAKPMHLYALTGKRRQQATDILKGRSAMPMVGRAGQLQILVDKLQQLQINGRSYCVAIEGEAGIGKSRLVLDLLDQARRQGIGHLMATGDAIESSTPYHPYRSLFRQYFALDTVLEDGRPANSQAVQTTVLEKLAQVDPELTPLAPLLNVVLPLDLPESELTAELAGEVRANNTHKLFLSLLQDRAQKEPLLVILEDVHWFDSASWALTRLLQRDVRPLLLVLTARARRTAASDEYDALLAAENVQRLRLKTLEQADIETLVCQRLQVSRLPAPVSRLLYEKAAGHPMFSEELAYALRDTGAIRITNGECEVTGALRAVDFPDTIQGVITNRIDRLNPQHQLTLKVASVIGRVFGLLILRHIFPLKEDRPQLPEYLDDLTRAVILEMLDAESEAAYIFKHVITQEVAYGLLLFSQRQLLHRAVAEWYEQSFAEDLSPHYSLLAYHWRIVGDDSRAMNYLEKAARQALRNNANKEAIQALQELLHLNAENNAPASRLQVIRWQRQLGDAHMRLGLMADSQAHYQKALDLLRRSAPASLPRIILGMGKQIGRQLWHRLRPQRIRRNLTAEEAGLMAEAARVYQELVLIYYLTNNIPAFLHAILASLNLAERSGSAREMAEGYATMCVLAGAVPQLNLAPIYQPMALEEAHKLNRTATLAFVLLRIGTYNASVGEWAEAHRFTEEAMTHYERINDPRGWGDAANVLGIVLALEGKYEAGVQIYARLEETAVQHENVQHEGWALGGQASNHLRLGRLEEALSLAEKAIAVKHVGDLQIFMDSATVALAALRLGQTEKAMATADRALQAVQGVTPTAFTVESYLNLGLVYLAGWEMAQAGNADFIDVKDCQTAVRQVIKVLNRFPIGKPAALLCQGLYHWRRGKAGRAYKEWQKSLETAESFPIPYVAGLAHNELGQHLPEADPARRDHLQQAVAIFGRLQTTHELTAVQAAMDVR